MTKETGTKFDKMKFRFFVEQPGDEYGNRAYPPAVIEGYLTGQTIRVAEPFEFGAKWPTLNIGNFIPVSENAGPARMLEHTQTLDHIIKFHALWTREQNRLYNLTEYKKKGYGSPSGPPYWFQILWERIRSSVVLGMRRY